jgi:hypothetical protein
VKAIWQALADGRTVQYKAADGTWWPINRVYNPFTSPGIEFRAAPAVVHVDESLPPCSVRITLSDVRGNVLTQTTIPRITVLGAAELVIHLCKLSK